MRRRPHLSHLGLCALLALAMPAWGSSAYLSGNRHHGMLEPREPKPERAPGPRVTDREVVLETLDDGLRVRVKWTIKTDRPGWFAGRLMGSNLHMESLKLDQPRLGVHANSGGRNLYGWIDEDATVEAVAVLHDWTPGTPVDLQLLRSALGSVELDSEDFELRLEATAAAEIDESWWTGAERMRVNFERPGVQQPRNRRALITGQSGVGLTVMDSDLQGKARLSWQVLRGEVKTVAFTAVGVGADLEVTGPNVRSFSTARGKVVIELQEPTSQRVDVEVNWTQPVSGGIEAAMVAPALVPEAFRVETSLQIARGGDQEVVPTLNGWQPRAASQLPEYGQGLIEGTPTSAFVGQGRGTGQLGLFRFEPVSGPPTVVDVAQYTIATSGEGRVLMRALYEVRNERGQWLEVKPPEGMSFLGARVGADTAFPVEGDDGSWRIPLLRSVETVEGLLTFPVEVAFIGEVDEWGLSEDRELGLPTLSADVALSRVTLYLPPGYASQLDENEAGSVPAFSAGDGLAYGFGVGETGAAQADTLFQDAVSAWMDNDFDKAQVALDDLRNMGGENENVARLQSNLDLVSGNYQGEADIAMSRRIRDQARARGLDDERKAEDLRRRAEEAQVQGDYGGSSAYYDEYLEVNAKLQMLEQDESVEYKALEEKARKSVADNAYYEQSRSTASSAGKRKSKKGENRRSSGEETTVYDFETEVVNGALVTPDGAEMNRVVVTEEPMLVFDPSGRPDAVVDISGLDQDGRDVLDANAGDYADRDFMTEAMEGEPHYRDGQLATGGAMGDGAAFAFEGVTIEGYSELSPSSDGFAGGLIGSTEMTGGLGAQGRGRGGGGAATGAVVEVERASAGQVITQEEIQRVPVRAVQSVPGVTMSSRSRRGGGRGRKADAPTSAAMPTPSAAPMAPPPPPVDYGPEPSPEPEYEEYEESDDWADEDGEVLLEEVHDLGGRNYTQSVSLAKRERARVRLPSISAKKKAPEPAQPFHEPDTIEIFAEEPDVPEVTATSLSIVVPNLGGETVLYQKLLLPAGATPSVVVRAKTSKKDRRNR
ncbi:MAG: hypothetical protein KC912_07905 [Proteobacteria bacterium]|nr:hypothetical protein [Pseudomonadota bacterium]